MKNIKVAIITASDRSFAKQRDDVSGPTLVELCKSKNLEISLYEVLPDDVEILSKKMKEICEQSIADLILTTGGTGFSLRDVTPEATKLVITREAPGIPEAMRYVSLQKTPKGMLSRATAGIYLNTLIVNFPGSPKACNEVFDYCIDPIIHGIEILKGSVTDCGLPVT